MDSVAESDGGVAKRTRTEEIVAEVEVVRKKRRRENGEEELRRVAEIVLVLSAMGRMRGGRDPTATEKAMMAEAREKVVALCEELAPKDILPRESFGVVIDDLGLNRLKEHRLGFRTPKLSIADKLALTKRRMEESKTFVAQPASYQSQRPQNNGVPGESRALPPNVRVFSFEKPGHVPVSAGSFHPTPAAHVSSAASTPSSFRPPGAEAPAAAVSSTMPINIARDSPPVVPPRVDRAHIRPDGRPNGPSFVPHVPVSSSPDQRAVKTAPMPMQPQSGPWVNVGMQKKVPDHLPGRADGNANISAPQLTAQASADQTPKPVVSQTAAGSKPNMHQYRPMHFAHTSPVFNHHLEISKVVQKLLDPKLAERPTWSPPSRDYMNRAISCQFCKVTINGVEDVLVCDACEKGFHVGCLQSYNAKGIPRGEWHCPRCLAMNRGKPFPPKYGRVTRNMNASKGSSNSAENMFCSNPKPDIVDVMKVKQLNAINNGKADVKKQPQALKVIESSSESNLQLVNETIENDKCTDINKNDVPNSGRSPRETTGIVVEASLATSTGSSSDKLCQQAVKSEVFPFEDSLISERESRIPFISQTTNASDPMPTSSNQNNVDQDRLSNGTDASVYQHCDRNGVVERNKHCDGERQEKDAGKENVLEKERVHDQYTELSGALESGLGNVNWIGDIARVVDEKKFFLSCCVNGVTYKVQDYALFHSNNGKLTPLKIQGMWEDSQNSSKWLIVHKCYFPDDLPKEVGRPGAPQSNEVYESTHDSNVTIAVVQGPCEVLPFRKFGEENDSNQGPQTSDRTAPVFIRNWFYDESKRAFCPSAS